jgi:hypothetical protein
MSRKLKNIAAVLLICLMFGVNVASASGGRTSTGGYDDEAAVRMAADALVVRPVGIAATVLGGVLFIVSLPFSAIGGNTGEAYQRLVADPARFTFTRKLGEF